MNLADLLPAQVAPSPARSNSPPRDESDPGSSPGLEDPTRSFANWVELASRYPLNTILPHANPALAPLSHSPAQLLLGRPLSPLNPLPVKLNSVPPPLANLSALSCVSLAPSSNTSDAPSPPTDTAADPINPDPANNRATHEVASPSVPFVQPAGLGIVGLAPVPQIWLPLSPTASPTPTLSRVPSSNAHSLATSLSSTTSLAKAPPITQPCPRTSPLAPSPTAPLSSTESLPALSDTQSRATTPSSPPPSAPSPEAALSPAPPPTELIPAGSISDAPLADAALPSVRAPEAPFSPTSIPSAHLANSHASVITPSDAALADAPVPARPLSTALPPTTPFRATPISAAPIPAPVLPAIRSPIIPFPTVLHPGAPSAVPARSKCGTPSQHPTLPCPVASNRRRLGIATHAWHKRCSHAG